MKPETRLVKKIMKDLKTNGGWWVKVHGGPFQVAGIPDIIGLCRGTFYGFEVKVPGQEETLTDLQKYVLRQINKHGGIAAMITSLAEARSLLRRSL